MSSSNSSVVMSGMVVLENPQDISPRVTAFKALIWVGGAGLEQRQACLRYFRSEFEETPEYPPVGLYNVTFVAAKMEPGFEVNEEGEEERLKYHLFTLLQALDVDDPNAAWTINPCQQICVHVCCAVTSDDQKAATFTAAPEQYTSIAADAKRAAEENGRLAASGIKPTPYAKRYCGFSGFLTGISGALEGEKMVDRFRIAVDTIAFMGAVVSSVPKAKSTPKNTDSKMKASRTWSYSTPVTGNKRRRPNSGDAGPSSSPSINAVQSKHDLRKAQQEWRRRKAKASLRDQSYELSVLKKEELLLGQLQQELLELGQKVHLLSAKFRQPRAEPRHFIIPISQGPVSEEPCIYCTPQQSVVFPVEKEEQKRDGPHSRPHSVPLPVEQEEEVELKNNFETFPVSFVRTER
ncbi:hypothetical protein B0H14DRAFT_3908248 [Mycena olivaceomarginata]|nr:hypothetical protein B0H14DRAFT_3908248 [Mycena olivaceomarginata]